MSLGQCYSLQEYNDVVDELASMSQMKRGLEEQNFSLQALLKEHEENYNVVLAENECLKKTLTTHEKKLESFQKLQQEFVETNSAFQTAESNNRELKLKLQQSEKICANLQQKLDETVEQKCEAAAALVKISTSYTECRKELAAQKEVNERLILEYETDKQILCERITALEDIISGLESKNKILNEIKSELELKVASVLEESANMSNSWRNFLSDSSSGSSICLRAQGGNCHQFCGTESFENYRKTLHAELQASGDLCLTHKMLEDQLVEWQEKATKYKQELAECKENENIVKEMMTSIVQHLDLSGHCGGICGNELQIDLTAGMRYLTAEVEKITEVVKAKQSLSYLISLVRVLSEMKHLFHKISKQCLVHPREVFTQTDHMVVGSPIVDQTVWVSSSERSTQTQTDTELINLSTIDQTAQVYTQADAMITKLSIVDQNLQISGSEEVMERQIDSVLTKASTMDETIQASADERLALPDPNLDQCVRICCSERVTQTQADSVATKESTMDQTAQISADERCRQADPIVTKLSILDQDLRISGSERVIQIHVDSVLTKMSTMDQTSQVFMNQRHTQDDPIITNLSNLGQTVQLCGSEGMTQTHADSVLTKVPTMDETAQISGTEKYKQSLPRIKKLPVMDQTADNFRREKCIHTETDPRFTKLSTMGQTAQIPSSETSTQMQSGAIHPCFEENRCVRGFISIESHQKTIADCTLTETEELVETLLADEETRCGAQKLLPPTEQAYQQHSRNDRILDAAPESCGPQESQASIEQTYLQHAQNDIFVDKAPESTFRSELLQQLKKFLRAAVSFKNLRRTCTLTVFLFLMFVIGSSFLNLFTDCCLYSDTYYGTLCSVMKDVLNPYVQLRHLSPPPT